MGNKNILIQDREKIKNSVQLIEVKSKMNKIRILVAHDDKTIKEKIVDSIKNLEYVEIVGTTTHGDETYNKIINLKPEMVFTQ